MTFTFITAEIPSSQEVLPLARSLLVQQGWRQGFCEDPDPDGPLCLGEAVVTAFRGLAELDLDQPIQDMLVESTERAILLRVLAAANSIAPTPGVLVDMMWVRSQLPWWNDRPGRTVEQALAALEAAA